MRIAIIGAGNLGLSIAKGIVMNQTHTSLYLTKRNLNALEKWSDYENVQLTTDNREAVQNSDILIFAVQPSQLENILTEIKDLFTDKHVLISTITGFKIGRMEGIIGSDYPIIRSMPNTAIAVGKSMTCLCTNQKGKSEWPLPKRFLMHWEPPSPLKRNICTPLRSCAPVASLFGCA